MYIHEALSSIKSRGGISELLALTATVKKTLFKSQAGLWFNVLATLLWVLILLYALIFLLGRSYLQNNKNHILDLSGIYVWSVFFNHMEKLWTDEGPNEVEKLIHSFNLGLCFL